MKLSFSKIWAWAHSKDLYTWIAHGIIGYLITLAFGWQFTAGAFSYREVSDLVNWMAEDQKTRDSFDSKLKDGFFDLWAPLAGAALGEITRNALGM